MPVVVPLTLLEAIDALAAHPGAIVLAGGTDADGRDQRGSPQHRHGRRGTGRVAVDRVAELRSWTIDPAARTVTLGAGVTYAELMAGAAGDAAAGAGRGVPHRRVAADPRSPARSAATSPRARRPATGCRCCRRSTPIVELTGRRRRSHDVGARVHGRGQAHRARARRADHRGHGAAARRLAGLRQGRCAQRDGDRHRQRLPRRRHAGALGPPRARLRRPDDHPGDGGGGVRGGCRRLGRAAPSPTTTLAGSASWPPPPAGRSTTTGRPRPTAATPSACWRRASCAGRSRGVERERAVHAARQRRRPRRVRRVARREPAVRAARAARPAGAKGACEQGECGSCSVLVDDRLVCSCLVLAASAVGRRIVTVEGLAEPGAPSDVQQAFVDAGAVQCGFCTPGLIIAAHALLDRIPEPIRPRDPRGAVGQHLPLHRLRPDHRRRAARRRRPPRGRRS